MLRIAAGSLRVWPAFTLDLTQDLCFEQEHRYQLWGANGSGKSSFLQKILLPQLQNAEGSYIVYLQQQMHLQLYALKAHAAFHAPGRRITDAHDAAEYLLDDLSKTYPSRPKDIFIIADESPALELLLRFPLPHCLILIDHQQKIPEARRVIFEAQNPTLTQVYPDA